MMTSVNAALGALLVFTINATSVLADPTAPGTPAVAPSSPSAATAAISKDHDPNQVICKLVEVTGSRLGSKRTCRTREAWDEMTRQAREQADDMRTQGLQGPPH